MKYLSAKFYESELFYQNYYYANITFEEYIKCEMEENDDVFNLEQARSILEKKYELNVQKYFHPNLFFYDELRKYLIDEKGEIIPLDSYNFFKLRMYATKFLIKSDEADNALKEEKIKIENGKYPIALKELVRCAFHDYEVEFEEDRKGIIAKYYLGEEEPYYIYRFEKVLCKSEFTIGKRFASIIYEEVFEDNGKITYNVLTPNSFDTCDRYSDISIEFRNIRLIKDCNDTF
jgi:hypothetical protein